MELTRSTWTDSRLDDFAVNTDRRFDGLERQMGVGFKRVDDDLREIRGELSSIQRTMVHVGAGLIGSQLAITATMVGLIVTQL